MTRHPLARALAVLLCLIFPAGALGQGAASDVEISLEHFGVGDVCRPGDWVAVSLQLFDNGDRVREIVVSAALTDADGDRPRPLRVVTSNPGVQQRVWLYFRLPHWFGRGATIPITAHEVVAEGSDDALASLGRLVGSEVLTPSRVLHPSEGVIGVVGRTRAGLGQYEAQNLGDPWLPTGHERTEIADGIDPLGLPDKWPGLIMLDALVWADGPPWELRQAERAQALRDWVSAGGHLVIILPRVGQAWLSESTNPLADLLPDVTITRLEGVSLEPYRGLLTTRRIIAATNAVVHEFEPRETAAPGTAIRVLQGTNGRCVVARRLHGTGAVTLVGIDVTQPALASNQGVEADVFWHRVLGRRGDLYTDEQLASLRGGQFNASRDPTVFDESISRSIAKTGAAGAGVLLGLVVFALYWVVAGPGGFQALKIRKLTKHAWVGFALASVLFSVLAWTGARAIRPGRVQITHMRFLDHVYGQPVQRARTFASVLTPWYGEAELSVATADWELGAISPWDPAEEGAGPGVGFPDARDYEMHALHLDRLRVPARATVKQVRVDWAGAPRWAMPLPVAAEGETEGRIVLRPRPTEPGDLDAGEWTQPELEGVLVHELPQGLTDLVVVVNRGLKDSVEFDPAERPGALLAEATAYSPPIDVWRPGEGLDLSVATRVQGRRGGRATPVDAASYFEDIVPRPRGMLTTPRAPSPAETIERLTAIAFFPLLEPPDIRSQSINAHPLVRRFETHGWDLGRWFTRPCVIIVGHMQGEEPAGGPAQIRVNGRPYPSSGRTIVRWIYPLPDDPPLLFPPRSDESLLGEPG